MGAQIPLLGHPRLAPKGGASARALLGEQEFSLLRATVEVEAVGERAAGQGSGAKCPNVEQVHRRQ